MPGPRYLKNHMPRTLPPTKVNGFRLAPSHPESFQHSWDLDYAAAPWVGKLLKADGAWQYPVVWTPQVPPDGAFYGARSYVDGPKGWAKAGRLLRHPQAVVFNFPGFNTINQSVIQAALAFDGLDQQLSDMGCFAGVPPLLSNQLGAFPDFLAAGLPSHDVALSSDAGVDADYIAANGPPSPNGQPWPWKEQYREGAFVGGECLFIIVCGTDFSFASGWGTFGPYDLTATNTSLPQVAGSWQAYHAVRTDKLAHDVGKIAAASRDFARAAWRVYYTGVAPGTAVTNTPLVYTSQFWWDDAQTAAAQAQAQGVDLTLTPYFATAANGQVLSGAQVAAIQAQMRADIRDFYGL